MGSFKLYICAWFGGSIFNAFLLILICNSLGFDSRSAICVYLYGIPGFFIKGSIAFLPYLFFIKAGSFKGKALSVLLAWIPFVLFILWYSIVIGFELEDFYTDLEFGYISRLPHCIVQVFTVFLTGIIMTVRISRKRLKVVSGIN